MYLPVIPDLNLFCCQDRTMIWLNSNIYYSPERSFWIETRANDRCCEYSGRYQSNVRCRLWPNSRCQGRPCRPAAPSHLSDIRLLDEVVVSYDGIHWSMHYCSADRCLDFLREALFPTDIPTPCSHARNRPRTSSTVFGSSKTCRSVDKDAPLLIADSIMEEISTSSSKCFRVVQ